MGYIGKPPEQGRYGKLDQISSGFNGSTATFNLTVGSEAVYPVNPQALIISLNGVIQQPGTDFTVSAATITFTTNPASGVGFFGVILGDALDIGTPSDGSVTVAKMAANSVDSSQYVDGSIDRVHLVADIIDGTKIADDVINSEHYAAASIDNEHLADNAVNSAELAAGSVDTAHIANSQITNALMADDAIGVAELSATGTASSSTFLRGDNAWAAAGATDIGALVKKSAYQSISDDSLVTVTFDLEDYDTDNIHDNSTNNSRLTCKTAGKYLIFGRVIFAAVSAGCRGIKLLLNGSGIFDYIVAPGASNLSGGVMVAEVRLLAVNDYVELQTYQTGASQSINIKYTTFTVFGMQQLVDTT